MTYAVLRKVLLWWAAIMVMAIMNGLLRERLLIPVIGLFAGQITSGVILSAIIFLVSYIAVPGLGHLEAAQYWTAGLVWLAVTLIFETGFGLFAERKELYELLRAYTFKDGNIWPVVLASVLVSPRLAAHLRGLS